MDASTHPAPPTSLRELLQRHAEERDGSGFALLSSGRDALLALHDLAAASERTLDLQYYIWRKDDSGRLLMSALLQAADRGVRVRILLDGWEPSWSIDEIAGLSAHRNLEIRLFNPALGRRGRFLDLLRNPGRINHRMHNKAFIADDMVAVVGGRNVSDRYFAIRSDGNYRDLDLFVTGPLVTRVTASFEAFWGSRWSVSPASGAVGVEDLAAVRATLQVGLETAGEYPLGTPAGTPVDRLAARLPELVWADAAYLAVDPPSKTATSEPSLLREVRRRLSGTLDSELLVESAYFIPRGEALRALCRLAVNDVRIRVLTNSLQSSDAATTYAGYRRIRPRLLRCGVELYELQGPGGLAQEDHRILGDATSAKLHSKAAVIDRRYVLVGSFNADPRSVKLNTEIALLIDSPELAGQVAQFIGAGMAGDVAYRPELRDARLVWCAQQPGGGECELRREPGWTMWRGLWLRLLSILPIDEQI